MFRSATEFHQAYDEGCRLMDDPQTHLQGIHKLIGTLQCLEVVAYDDDSWWLADREDHKVQPLIRLNSEAEADDVEKRLNKKRAELLVELSKYNGVDPKTRHVPSGSKIAHAGFIRGQINNRRLIDRLD